VKVLVLGAGVVGTTTAWYLHAAGHDVTVLDRQDGPALETSFANGGQISVSHAEPWANPQVLPKALRWLGREDAPLLYRWRLDPALWRWTLAFLRECTPARTRSNIAAIVSLALYSREKLQALRQTLPLDYDQLQRGILHIYSDEQEFAGAIAAAKTMREFGLDREPVSADRCLEIEPALAAARPLLVGGDYTPSDESGDAHRFTCQLAAAAAAHGVAFRYRQQIEKLALAAGQIAGVVVRGEQGPELLTADAYVLALGSYSPLLARPLGLRLPVYPGKGYSATLPLAADSIAPQVSLTDDGHKLVFSRLGQRLRIAGTAEFNGYNLDLNPVRCQALLRRATQLFPELRPAGEAQFWCGLRPVTPGNRPLVGQSPIPNLWLNTGHGTLGWTLSCGSAAALADQMSGRPLERDLPLL
jgi:D-amino-acid dehydrogenase